jgi:hypothetical protein
MLVCSCQKSAEHYDGDEAYRSVLLASVITVLTVRIAGPTLRTAQLALERGSYDTSCRNGPSFRAQFKRNRAYMKQAVQFRA